MTVRAEKVEGRLTLPDDTAPPANATWGASGLQKHAQAYLFMLPAMLIVLVVSVYPIVYSIYLSLFKTKFLERVEFIGLANYLTLLRDPTVWSNVRLSALYVFGTICLVIPFSIAVAVLLNQNIRYRGLIRALVILPWAISQTIIALLWGWILNPDFGPGVYLIELLGMGRVALLSDPVYALLVLIFVNAWATYPLATTLILAAIQTVPAELSDASQVDGASRWQNFYRITLPLIRPTIMVATILISLHSFNMVTLIFVLTGGGPMGSTEVLSLRTFNTAFQFWQVGYASALGISLFVVNAVISLIYIRMMRQEALN